MKTRDITVVVPVYNTAPWLGRCIESLLAQTLPVNIVLVDDGSTDGSGEICDRYARHSNVTTLHQENRGAAAARNAGLAVADTEWVGFVDSDDWVEPRMFEELRALAEDDVDMVCCGLIHYLPGERTIHRNSCGDGTISGREALVRFLVHTIHPAPWNKVYRQSLFSGLSFPEGRVHEDEWIMPRLLAKARKVTHTDRALYHYVQREDSVMMRPYDRRALDALWAASETVAFVKELSPELAGIAEARVTNVKMSLLDRMLFSGLRKDTDMVRLTADIRAEIPRHFLSPGIRPHRKILALALYVGLPLYKHLRALARRLTGR